MGSRRAGETGSGGDGNGESHCQGGREDRPLRMETYFRLRPSITYAEFIRGCGRLWKMLNLSPHFASELVFFWGGGG